LTIWRLARVGDLKLDGSVTICDFINLASKLNAVAKRHLARRWSQLRRFCNIPDFFAPAANYSGSSTPIRPFDRILLSSFASAMGVDASVIDFGELSRAGSAAAQPGTMALMRWGVGGTSASRCKNDHK